VSAPTLFTSLADMAGRPMTYDRARLIELNDQLRTTFKGGRVQMTRDVYDLDDRLRGRALFAMSRYRNFDADNEHDWGVFIFAGYAFEWRIEYRNSDDTGISADPADPQRTFRVLTLYTTNDMLHQPRLSRPRNNVGSEVKSGH
jgi:uncharacterized protein DUF3768